MSIRLPLGAFFGINITEGLARCLNDHAFYWSQLGAFRSSYAASAETLATLIRANSLAQAEELSHTIKGTAGMLGLDEIQQASAGLYSMLKESFNGAPLSPKTDEALEQFQLAMDRFAEGMERLADRMKP